MKKFLNFKAAEVPLQGSNLIEASAGTGKTYSIAILVLRLILEKKLSVKEILMVTFTKAAVAELEERIRLFIRQAHKAAKGHNITDPTISAIVDAAGRNCGKEVVLELLKDAILFLDETSVLTIHSFCQQTLNEFAFETRQLFSAELVQDSNPVLDEGINKFWRKNVTCFPAELLSLLLEEGLSRSSIRDVVKEHLGGKRYLVFKESADYSFSDQEYFGIINSLSELKLRAEELSRQLLQYIADHVEDIKADSEKNQYSRRAGLHITVKEEPEKFIEYIAQKKESGYVVKLYSEILERIEVWENALATRKEMLQTVIRKINCHALNEVGSDIQSHKRTNNQMFFDDLIVNLHSALVQRDNQRLAQCLQKKYQAVFIDEFQDTDRLQYEIFQRAFGGKSILFYIGDPKQSIYAWRNADMFTYFKAQDAVDHLYSMNSNYRSSKGFISAMNDFFKPDEGFDTFHFGNESHSIDYTKVESPNSNSKGKLYNGTEVAVPLTITKLAKKDSIEEAVAAQVLELLASSDYWIVKKERSGIKPSDIGILVRTKKEGKAIKSRLAKLGIPAVTIGDDKVLKSDDAKCLLFVLEAMIDISRSSVSKALLTPFTGYDDNSIASLDYEQIVELFRGYRTSWEKDGIYTALRDFISDFRVKEALLENNREYGERIITNLYQLIELLHKVQTNKKLSPLELISWLMRGIEGMETGGDEYQLRIENDEDAVKIVTIHSSKGLEYNIVLAPFLDLQIPVKGNCCYRDPECSEYITADRSLLTDEQIAEHDKQLEQENRRLIYVAITRAVYKCFIYKNMGMNKNSSLLPFIDACNNINSSLIEIKESFPEVSSLTYKVSKENISGISRKPVQFMLLEKSWCRMSYSRLRADHEVAAKSKTNNHEDHYEHFVFSQLAKGAKTGNMLHYIFENVHFSDSSKWNTTIMKAINTFAPSQSVSDSMLIKMLEHVFNANIYVGNDEFKLSEVIASNRIHEFEFDFPVSSFRVGELKNLSDERIEIDVKDAQDLEGIMNGKIDLFFELKGKYYVLDWKSNFLGDSLSDYSADRLLRAMNENNYHLQYLLYTLAIKKYLESRLSRFNYDTEFGGVIYLFVRGVRKDSANGVFAYKPAIEKVEALQNILGGKEVKVIANSF